MLQQMKHGSLEAQGCFRSVLSQDVFHRREAVPKTSKQSCHDGLVPAPSLLSSSPELSKPQLSNCLKNQLLDALDAGLNGQVDVLVAHIDDDAPNDCRVDLQV